MRVKRMPEFPPRPLYTAAFLVRARFHRYIDGNARECLGTS